MVSNAMKGVMMNRKIRITCKADTFLPFTQIKDFQGELKSRTQDDIEHLITSIERHGFAFPFFVWRQPNGTCSCLDGHGRIMALNQMQREGYEIPELPVVYVDAASEGEARTKLIQINAVTGRFTDSGFRELVKDIPDLDLSAYNYPDLDLNRITTELSILKQAEENIKNDLNVEWEKELQNVDVNSESFRAKYAPGVSVSAPSSANNDPSVSVSSNGENASIVGASSTVYGEKPTFAVGPDSSGNPLENKDHYVQQTTPTGEREIILYCPECGESWVYKY